MATGDFASIKTQYIQLVPASQSAVPPGCFFLDLNNANAPSVKGTDAATSQVTTSSGGGANYFVKAQVASGPIAINRPLGKRSDGKVVDAMANGTTAQQDIIAYSLVASSADGDIIATLTVGPNLAGALTGLNFAPGDEIYLSQVGGYTNNPATLTDPNDSVIKLGIADCAAGTASNVATDLIGFTTVVSRP